MRPEWIVAAAGFSTPFFLTYFRFLDVAVVDTDSRLPKIKFYEPDSTSTIVSRIATWPFEST